MLLVSQKSMTQPQFAAGERKDDWPVVYDLFSIHEYAGIGSVMTRERWRVGDFGPVSLVKNKTWWDPEKCER